MDNFADIVWGISAATHDASLTVMQGDTILFASHSERFTGIKNDKHLSKDLVRYALRWGHPTKIYWYEDPYWKATRKIFAGQKRPWLNPKEYLKNFIELDYIQPEIIYGDHHKSHAAASYYTSPFTSAAIVVADAIGEWTTTSIWHNMKCLKRWYYPKSLGLFYSAMTDRVGLKPNEDEYILMGMAAYGNEWKYEARIREEILESGLNLHKGIKGWAPELTTEQDLFDIAAGAQLVYEEEFCKLLGEAAQLTGEKNVVLSGGCALNCLANRLIPQYFENNWIMPNPGDAGSSLGAILAAKDSYCNWGGPYLGYNIIKPYPIEPLVKELKSTGMAGVANGPAEFGPRALGNRSLLADPRGETMKAKVNTIKNRQEFRPFAPVIRQEDVSKVFNVEKDFVSPYMQYIVTCKFPDKYPAIVHKDGTSRVQTVTRKENAGLYDTLTRWYQDTGCPLLLNTSLNIKGQPIVNDEADAKEFEEHYKVKVF